MLSTVEFIAVPSDLSSGHDCFDDAALGTKESGFEFLAGRLFTLDAFQRLISLLSHLSGLLVTMV